MVVDNLVFDSIAPVRNRDKHASPNSSRRLVSTYNPLIAVSLSFQIGFPPNAAAKAKVMAP
jgi:hypothetical protein